MNIGRVVCEVIPFKNFKEKLKLTQKYSKYRVEVYKNYLFVFAK